ncbi:MAG: stalk domain-containing protein [Defluviitaleaceae bacterium]|nr:stalk domain-containing protein [Defluviitaleaceae bacterium]
MKTSRTSTFARAAAVLLLGLVLIFSSAPIGNVSVYAASNISVSAQQNADGYHWRITWTGGVPGENFEMSLRCLNCEAARRPGRLSGGDRGFGLIWYRRNVGNTPYYNIPLHYICCWTGYEYQIWVGVQNRGWDFSQTSRHRVRSRPTVKFPNATNITPNSVTLHGYVYRNWATFVNQVGFEYRQVNTARWNPVGTRTPRDENDREISHNLTGLLPNTRYEFRAFAVNTYGLRGYSDPFSFTTSTPTPPEPDRESTPQIGVRSTGMGANLDVWNVGDFPYGTEFHVFADNSFIGQHRGPTMRLDWFGANLSPGNYSIQVAAMVDGSLSPFSNAINVEARRLPAPQIEHTEIAGTPAVRIANYQDYVAALGPIVEDFYINLHARVDGRVFLHAPYFYLTEIYPRDISDDGYFYTRARWYWHSTTPSDAIWLQSYDSNSLNVRPQTPPTNGCQGCPTLNYVEMTSIGGFLMWDSCGKPSYGYRIFRSISPSGEGVSVTDFPIGRDMRFIFDANATNISGFEPGMPIYYRVEAVLEEARLEINENGDPIIIPEVLTDNFNWVRAGIPVDILVPPHRTRGSVVLQIGSMDMQIEDGAADSPRTVQNDAAPFIDTGRTMLPVRAMSDGIGADINWDAADRRIDLTALGLNEQTNDASMWIERVDALVNNQSLMMDVAPNIWDGRTFIPVRYAAEFLGSDIAWIASQQKVVIVFLLPN